MAGFKETLAAKKVSGITAAEGVAVVRPDALVLHGAEGLAALDKVMPPFAFEAARVFVCGAACHGVGAGRVAEYAARYGVTVLAAGEGCGAAALVVEGILRPGELTLLAGEDVGDADNLLYWPIGLDAVPAFLAAGCFRLDTPSVLRIECGGELQRGVMPADVGLYIAGQFGAAGAAGAVLELGGPLVAAWDARECAAALGAARACGPLTAFAAPAAAEGADATFNYDFKSLPPQVGVWRDGGAKVVPLAEAAGTPVRLVVLGPASAADLAVAARLLAGARVSSRVTLFAAAATRRDFLAAVAAGDLATLAAAGAAVLSPCAARWLLSFDADDAVVTTALCPSRAAAARRMTAYHVNPAAAAAAALAGQLCDPTPIC